MAASALLAVSALAGCGFDGVELNGSVFDYLGVSGQADRGKEPKLEPRPGVVLPPQLDRLPEPGSTDVATPQGEAWPVDPEQSKVAAAEQLDRQHETFCRDALWRARAQGQGDVQIKGPKGMCNPSILRNLTGKDITTR
ncbi:MAG: hypothetical protein KJZ80_20950 [Hyphomicrobiaceae bacterium]|nr:hypothetical protein [Hyphomicrobiaceae bacterium]